MVIYINILHEIHGVVVDTYELENVKYFLKTAQEIYGLLEIDEEVASRSMTVPIGQVQGQHDWRILLISTVLQLIPIELFTYILMDF